MQFFGELSQPCPGAFVSETALDNFPPPAMKWMVRAFCNFGRCFFSSPAPLTNQRLDCVAEVKPKAAVACRVARATHRESPPKTCPTRRPTTCQQPRRCPQYRQQGQSRMPVPAGTVETGGGVSILLLLMLLLPGFDCSVGLGVVSRLPRCLTRPRLGRPH